MEHSSALPQIEISSYTKPCPHYALFNSLLPDDSKQYAATTTAHSKHLIELLKNNIKLASTLSIIWEILMVVQRNIDVPQHYTLCQFYPNVAQLYFIGV